MMELHAIIARYAFAGSHTVGSFVRFSHAIPYVVGFVVVIYDLIETRVAVGNFFFKVVIANIT